MAFCSNCGKELKNGAKFCDGCGMSVLGNDNQRKTAYDGVIHKCPNCGEIINSFVTICPACGIELRGIHSTNSVREFASKLEAIESQRECEKTPTSFFERINQKQQISKTDEQKINLIKNFSVPNTKEDILEFMILATSNIDMSTYSSDTPNANIIAMNEAWNAKIKQVYAKAKNTYKTDPDFLKIQELYDSCYIDITKQKKKIT